MIGIVLLGLSISIPPAFAQDKKVVKLDQMITELDSLIAVTSVQTTLPVVNEEENWQEIQNLLSDQPDADLVKNVPGSAVINAEKKSLQRDKGISLEAGYLHNVDQGVFGTEGIYYDQRYQVGLKWDLLKNGWLDHASDVKALDREQKIRRIDHKMDMHQKRNENLQEIIKAVFNSRQLQHLKDYLDALTVQQAHSRELYEMGYKSWNDILDITSSKSELALKYQTLLDRQKQYNATVVASMPQEWPVLNIDRSKIEQHLRENTNQQVIDSLRLENTRLEHNVWNEISLSANLRYNYYGDRNNELLPIEPGDREYFSLGLNLSVPFTVFKNDSELFEQAHRQTFSYQQEEHVRQATRTLDRYYNEYQQLLRNYANLWNQHVLTTEEVLRVQFNRTVNERGYSPAAVLSNIMTLYETKSDIIETKRALYEKLLQIKALVPGLAMDRFTERWDIPDLLEQENRESDIYIWSHTFETYPNYMLIQYLTIRRHNTVLLSPGKINSNKTVEFIDMAKRKGLQVQLMMGNNTLMHSENWNTIKTLIARTAEFGADGIHLDVEPHTLPDWENHKDRYLEQYVGMIRFAHRMAKAENLQLSVSIPVFYDSILQQLSSIADGMYVMAYGTDNLQKVIGRIAEEYRATSMHDNKIRIVLRPDDFKSPLAMKEFMNSIEGQMSQVKFALHDLEKLVKIQN